MELPLTERQQSSLSTVAALSGRSASDLVAKVQIGIDQIARGEFLEEDEMDERVARMLKA